MFTPEVEKAKAKRGRKRKSAAPEGDVPEEVPEPARASKAQMSETRATEDKIAHPLVEGVQFSFEERGVFIYSSLLKRIFLTCHFLLC